MARRSATNERYQKYTGPSGKTRKSAAAAKPKRSVGGAATTKPKSGKSSSAKREPMIINPPTAEYKRWRMYWWVLLGAALVLTGGSWLVRSYVPGATVLASVMLAAGYASIFGALYIDWTKLRKLRMEWMSGGRERYEKELADKTKADKAAAKAAGTTESKTAETSADDKS